MSSIVKDGITYLCCPRCYRPCIASTGWIVWGIHVKYDQEFAEPTWEDDLEEVCQCGARVKTKIIKGHTHAITEDN